MTLVIRSQPTLVEAWLQSPKPLSLLYGAAARRQHTTVAPRAIYALAGGYVALWAMFRYSSVVCRITSRVPPGAETWNRIPGARVSVSFPGR